MKLNGNKLTLGALILASASVSYAEVSAPNLNEFTAGTPAKASEVNENFEGLKAYSEGMQALIEAQAEVISELEAKAQALQSENSALANRASLLESDNTLLKNKVSTLETNDSTLSGRITQNTELTNGLGVRTTALEATTNTLTTDVASITTRTTALEATDVTLTTNVTALETQGDALEAGISALTTRTTSAEDAISGLGTRVTALENAPAPEPGEDPYSIAVYGDDVLIGYAKSVPAIRTSARMPIKTAYGYAKLKGGYNNDYVLEYWDPTSDAESWGEPYFTDDACTNAVHAIYSGEGTPMVLTKNAGLTDSAKLLLSGDDDSKKSYVLEAGTAITTVSTLYRITWEGVCSLADYMTGDIVVMPIVELNPDVHGIQKSYSTISVDGYVLN